MSIIRGPRPSDNYAQIHNAALADGRLSFKARGLLAYLLSRPPGWKTSVERLAEMGKDGEAGIKSGLKELEKYGYLRRHRGRTPEGTFTYDQEVTDVPDNTQPELPTDTTDTTSGFSTGGESTGGLSTSGKPPGINNNEPITLIKDGVVGNSPTEPTPTKRRGWYPSDAAIASAQQHDPILDIPLHVTRYIVVKAERHAQPDSAEWLRWFIEDEKKARAEEREKEASRFRQRKWYDVAE
jgi:hypothetical protein